MSSLGHRLVLCTAALALATLSFVLPARGDSPGGVQPLDDYEVVAATGRSITEWGNSWWAWAFDHPEVLSDTTGEFGALGDVRGPVFFAEGSGGEPLRATVDVPRSKYLLVPVATYVWTFFDPCAEIRCARRIINENFIKGIRDVFVRIDGKPIDNIASHLVRVERNHADVFVVDAGPIGEDGYGGILPALQGGYWVMLERLPPGTHVLAFGATVPELDPSTGEPTGGTVKLDARLKVHSIGCQRRPCSW